MKKILKFLRRHIKIIVAILLVILIVGTLAVIKGLQIRTLMDAGASFVPPPETVSSAIASQEKWQDTLSAVGTITAAQGVEVSTELSGIVTKIGFESGSVVTNGTTLIQLDVALEEAQLRAAEAQADLARVNAERSRVLREEKAISQAELDTAEATLKETRANADALKATIAKKTIRAPFAGRVGIRLVDLGQFLEAGEPVVSLQSLEPMHADFSLPQKDFAQLAEGMTVRLLTDAYPEKKFEGKLTAITPRIDEITRSVRLQATFDNREKLLRAGMFARIEVLLPSDQNVLVVPATAILAAPFGDSVYVIESKPADTNGPAGLIARQQFVKTGRSRGDFVSVETGLKPGEKVASSGLFKLRNGISVVENNELAPEPKLAPKPSDS